MFCHLAARLLGRRFYVSRHVYIYVKFHRLHEMHIFTGIYTYPQAESQWLHGISSFYVGTPILIVRMGKILLFTRGAYFHSGMPIFAVKMGTRMPIFT